MFGRRQQATRTPDRTDAEPPFLQAFRTADGGMVVRLDPAKVGSPGVAGIMLVDMMRHFARALTQYGVARSEEEATAEMLKMFDAEVRSPTDLGSGSIVN